MAQLNLGKLRLKWRGAWNASNTYYLNDVVRYNGSSYIAVSDNFIGAGTPDVTTAQWDTMASAASQNTTRGDMTVRGASGDTRLGIGASGYMLQSSGTDPFWGPTPYRPNDAFSKIAHMNDVGLGTGIFAGITSDGKQIKVAGRDASVGALVAGNDIADVYNDVYLTAHTSPPLDSDDYFVDLAVGDLNVAAVTNKGYLYVGGRNNYGQLGQGDTTNRQYLRRVDSFYTGGANPRTITKAYIGNDEYWNLTSIHVLTSTGEVWGAGSNSNGELGNGNTTNQSTFVRAGSITGITGMSVSGSQGSIYAWNAAGQLWVWGRNAEGQLGLGNTTVQTAPVASLTNVKKVVSVCSNFFNGTDHSSIAAYAVLVKNDGTVWGTGINTQGELGLNDATNRTAWTQATTAPASVTDVFIGGGGQYGQTFVLTSTGYVYGSGLNWNGNLSLGNTTQYNVFTQAVLPTGMQGTITSVKACSTSRYSATFFYSSSLNKLAFAGANIGGVGNNYSTVLPGANNMTTAQLVSIPPGVTIKDYQPFDAGWAWAYEAGFGLALLSTAGEMYSSGTNTYAQLGRQSRRVYNTLAPVQV